MVLIVDDFRVTSGVYGAEKEGNYCGLKAGKGCKGGDFGRTAIAGRKTHCVGRWWGAS